MKDVGTHHHHHQQVFTPQRLRDVIRPGGRLGLTAVWSTVWWCSVWWQGWGCRPLQWRDFSLLEREGDHGPANMVVHLVATL